MGSFSLYELLFYFFLYGVLGWILEVIFEKVKTDRFVNRGFLNGPFCPIYAFGAIILLLTLTPFKDNLVILFLISFLVASILEYVASYILELVFKERWWDYHQFRFHINGRICLPFSLLWGVGGILLIRFVHPVIAIIFSRVPLSLGITLLVIAVTLLIIDLIVTVRAMVKLEKILAEFGKVKTGITELTAKQLEGLSRIHKRVILAFPTLESLKNRKIIAQIRTYLLETKNIKEKIKKLKHPVLNKIYELTCFFVIGSLVGFLFESVVCFFNYGTIYNRQGLIYGPFIPIYGGGLIIFIIIFGHVKSKRTLFLGGALVGGAFEYLCSWVQEVVFGSRSWYYTKNFLNINGRTSPFHMVAWGLLILIFMKAFYPTIKKLLMKVKPSLKWIISVVMIVFMTFNITISWIAAYRQTERHKGIAPEGSLDVWLDKTYPDERMDAIFSNKWWIDE